MMTIPDSLKEYFMTEEELSEYKANQPTGDDSVLLADGIYGSNYDDERETAIDTVIFPKYMFHKQDEYFTTNIMNEVHSFVCYDELGTLLNRTEIHLEKQGYDICVFDMGNPSNSQIYNPLDFIYTEDGKVNIKAIIYLSDTIIDHLSLHASSYEEDTTIDIFEKMKSTVYMQSKQWFRFCLLFVVENMSEDKRDFSSVLDLIDLLCKKKRDQVISAKDIIASARKKNPSAYCFAMYDNYLQKTGKTFFRDVLLVLKNLLAPLRSRSFLPIISASANSERISITDMTKRKTALFIHPDARRPEISKLFTSIIYTQLLENISKTTLSDDEFPIHVMLCPKDRMIQDAVFKELNEIKTLFKNDYNHRRAFISHLADNSFTSMRHINYMTAFCNMVFMDRSDIDIRRAFSLAIIWAKQGHKNTDMIPETDMRKVEEMEEFLSTIKFDRCVVLPKGHKAILADALKYDRHSSNGISRDRYKENRIQFHSNGVDITESSHSINDTEQDVSEYDNSITRDKLCEFLHCHPEDIAGSVLKILSQGSVIVP